MEPKQRPLSPFMIGPYYRPQLTSLLSIAHRASGVLLSILGAPLLLWWVVALASGPGAYAGMVDCLSGWLGRLALLACLLSLCYHLCNGIRHLVWDSGRGLDLRTAYASGWLVLVVSTLLAGVLLGILLGVLA